MSSLYYLLDQGDFCFLSVAVLILMWLGQYMVRGREDHRRVGLCAGAASFLIFAICGVIMNWPLTSEDLVRVTLRALTAGGMFLGIGWILASVLGVAFQQSVLRLWRWNQERLRRQQTEAETTPEETEADQEDVIDLEILEGENLEAQERREELILHLETVYLQHREELKDRFSVEELEQSLERFLCSDLPIDVLEKRATLLEQLIEQQANLSPAAIKDRSLASHAETLDQQLQEIQESTLDARTIDSLKRMLQESFLRKIKKRIEES